MGYGWKRSRNLVCGRDGAARGARKPYGSSTRATRSSTNFYKLLERCLEKLPSLEAVIVRRHDLEGVPLDAVAKEIGITQWKARTLHGRAHSTLRKQFVQE